MAASGFLGSTGSCGFLTWSIAGCTQMMGPQNDGLLRIILGGFEGRSCVNPFTHPEFFELQTWDGMYFNV